MKVSDCKDCDQYTKKELPDEYNNLGYAVRSWCDYYHRQCGYVLKCEKNVLKKES